MPAHIVPFPPFEPDKAFHLPNASQHVLNALPTLNGWRGMPSMELISSALPARCRGAVMHKDADGVTSIFAATQANLYRLTDTSWTQVSKATDAYSVPDGEDVAFEVFGDTVIANNLGTTPQKLTVGTDGAFSDLTDAPQAKYMWVLGDHLACGHLVGEPNAVACSGLNDIASWTYGHKGASKQDIADGGEIMGGIGDQHGAVVMMRDRIAMMQLAPGSRWTFTIATANDARGVAAPYSIAQIGPHNFVYLSEDGFFQGVEGRPIGAERVDRWFQSAVDLNKLFEVKSMADPFEKIVWWQFTKTDGSVGLIGWDWQLDRWCSSDLNIQTAARLATAAVTLDGDTGLLDDDASLVDSRADKGGRPTFAVFDTANRLAFLTGASLAATLDTAAMEFTPGRRSLVNGGRLMGNVGTYTAQTGGQDFHGDDVTWKGAVSPSGRSGLLPLRHSARLHRHRVNIPAGQAWDDVTDLQVDYVAEGRA